MADKKYWTGLEDLHKTEEFVNNSQKEFKSELPVEDFLANDKLSESSTGRRDFLKFLGFSVTAAAVAACETPVIKSIPYVNKPEDITPGVANYYASSFYNGQVFSSILVKTREGRPIHISGNKKDGFFGGAINAEVNTSVLGLYNASRLQAPTVGGAKTTWKKFDSEVKGALSKASDNGGEIAVLSNSIISPSAKEAYGKFAAKYANETTEVNHYQVDDVSYSGLTSAVEKATGERFVPFFDFSKAQVIVSVSADFLRSWLNPTVFVNQYKGHRNPEAGHMSKHYQFESNMSLSGSNADKRIAVKPSEELATLISIYNHLASKMGMATVAGSNAELDAKTKKAADDLATHKGKSLVVAGANSTAIQSMVLKINAILGNAEKTIFTTKRFNNAQGNDASIATLKSNIKAGKVKALIVLDSNPVYTDGEEWIALLKKVPTTIAVSEYKDETAAACKYVAAKDNYLESWNDFAPVTGMYALAQPTINRLYSTRNAYSNFLVWADDKTDYLDFIKGVWMRNSEGKTSDLSFSSFWNKSLHNGGVAVAAAETAMSLDASIAWVSSQSKIQKDGFELSLYQNELGAGAQANNPWLQELPDPITKVTWDNYLTVSKADAEKMDLNVYIGEKDFASVVKLTVGKNTVELPAYVTPGQKPGTVGLALGYGRGNNGADLGKSIYQTAEYGGYITDAEGKPLAIGVNGFQFTAPANGNTSYTASKVVIEKTDRTYPLACTQTHNTIMGRESIVKETDLHTFKTSDKHHYNHGHTLAMHENGETVQKPIAEVDLWDAHPVENISHRWGMAIDLTKCIGCGACVTACHSENNVPVVGKDEVLRSRDMHWLRIDRYFSSAEDSKKHNGEDFSYAEMEKPDENPTVVHMPMMCQHCNHAPCETVCPVAATTHSNEGLNQMTYNRCIGTRYCANNCPYKVRRFNWFNYQAYKKFTEVNPAQDDMGRLVLNPDVTVRARGVMEKCSMCVQRIQGGKLDAKKAGHAVKDGAIQTACAESCSMDAITFGDLNDTKSSVTDKANSDRGYLALEEVGTKPNIYYMVKVRNTEGSAHHS
jgi:molybdopterin-containing oxidoreductase family iron-sulfur binding subunit